MSKSKGTMYTLSDLTEKGIDPAAVRLELIKTHYRANADFSMQGLKDSARRIEVWRRSVREIMACIAHPELEHTYTGHDFVTRFADALHDDLNVALGISILDLIRGSVSTGFDVDLNTENALKAREARIKEIGKTIALPESPMSSDVAMKIVGDLSKSDNERSLAAIHLIDSVLGVIFRPIEKAQDTGIALYQPGVAPSPEIEALLQQRADAKKSKDFATADTIRDQLAAMNLSIMDKPGGKVEVAPAN